MRSSKFVIASASGSVSYLLFFLLLCAAILYIDKAPRVSAETLPAQEETGDVCSEATFRQAPEFAVGQNPKGVAAADFDGDGRTDAVAVFSFTTNGVSILRNLGNDRFAARQDILLAANELTERVFAQDLNGDGKAEIVITYNFIAKISILKNTSPAPGTISFDPKVDYAVLGNEARLVSFGDLDGDGKTDLTVSVAQNPTGFSVLRNTSAIGGNIAFDPRADVAVPGLQRGLALGDFDNDSKLDVALGSTPSGTLRIIRNLSTGAGNINFTIAYTIDLTMPSTVSMVAGDFDLDGKSDLAIVQNGNEVALMRNTGSGAAGSFAFAPPQLFPVGSSPYGIIAADFDNDGKPDLATANNSPNSVTVLRNSSSGAGVVNFADRPWDFGTGKLPYFLVSADFNNDSKPDILTANREGSSVSVLTNRTTAAGTDFNARKDYMTPQKAGVTNLSTADFDLDGNLDIAASFDEIRNTFRFSVYRGDGSGHFPARVDIQPTPPAGIGNLEPYIMAAGDFDGDGKTDMAMLGAWRNLTTQTNLTGLRVYRNTTAGAGNISFAVTNFSALTGLPKKILVADVDGDQKKDIIATFSGTSTNNDVAQIFRNTSSGTGIFSFDAPVSINFNGNGIKLTAGDLTLDNKLEIFHSGFNNSFTIQVNTGSAGQISFTPQPFTTPQFDFYLPVLADIDGDAKTDLVAASGSHIVVYKNTSPGGGVSFDAPVTIQNVFSLPTLAGDFDGDGKTDILAENALLTGGAISILKNVSAGSLINLVPGPQFPTGGSSSRISGDFNNDGRLDVATGAQSTIGTISVLINETCAEEGGSAPFDFDGDGKTDVSVFRPSDGSWWINRSSTAQTNVAQFGLFNDNPVPADYTGDGKTDIAFFRPSDGAWYILRSEDGSFFSFPFGAAEDIPAPADYDADGKADPAVYRPSSGTWYILNSSNSGTSIVQFGSASDKPVAADYDGDGKTDIAIFRPADGSWWYLQSSNSQFKVYRFGLGTDKPVQGDYSGDGKADIAVWRPSTGEWYFQRSEDNSYYSVPFGALGDVPVPGDYDGDGRFDTAVFRPATANWFVQRSSAGILITSFGASGDRPIPNAFVP